MSPKNGCFPHHSLKTDVRTLLIFIFFYSSFFGWSQNSINTDFQYPIPPNEVNCMKHFKKRVDGIDPVNAFLLAKMTELTYPERLDYQLRYLQNDSKPVRSIPSTSYLKQYPKVVNKNFRDAFEQRFSHYFQENIDSLNKKAEFYYLERFKFDTLQFLGIQSVNGYDPELIIINTDSLILLLYRGTDDVNNNRFAEWKGTDFNFAKCQTDPVFNQAKVHKGFYKSFNLIRDDLDTLLNKLNAAKKSIWISGHSLGGSMAILTGIYLQQKGYPVENIYTYATPRALGDTKLASLCDSILPNKIHRFEYYLDPVTILWKSGFENIGKRYWFDNATKGNYAYYPECAERRFARIPLEYRRRPFANNEKREMARIKREQNDLNITDLPAKFFYHNTQWYVYATYKLISDSLKSELPKVDDSFPYIYYGWKKAK